MHNIKSKITETTFEDENIKESVRGNMTIKFKYL